MRYIEKGDSPEFFEDCKGQLPTDAVWDHFDENQELGRCKRQLRQHLIDEQTGLCIYCECKINADSSHIEHVFPKSEDKYPEKTFDYSNLVASCNGDKCDKNQEWSGDERSCGHWKSDEFSESLFLNPVADADLGDYFVFNKTHCTIESSPKNSERADYTITCLNLNSARLCNERSNARKALEKALRSRFTVNRKQQLQQLLSRKRPFISFLRFNYAEFLETQS